MNQLIDIEAKTAPKVEDASAGAVACLARVLASPKGVWRRAPTIVLWLGAGALIAPTLIENVQQNWSLDQSAQGPIVLAIGLWLLARRWPAMRAAGAAPKGAVSMGLVIALWLANSFIYVLGRAAGLYMVESYALYGFLLIGVYAAFGARGLRAGGFALAYLMFALPSPPIVAHDMTIQLRLAITDSIVQLFQAFGVPIVKDGLTLMVDQYQLSVEDACSGMNSLFSLSAIGLVYVYLRRPRQPLYYALTLAPIVGFAIFSNFVRIAVVVLVTHLFGDAVAQSFLHEATGFLTFAVALGAVIALDALVGPWLARRRPGASDPNASDRGDPSKRAWARMSAAPL